MAQASQNLNFLIEAPYTLFLLSKVGLQYNLSRIAFPILYPSDLIYTRCATLSDLTHNLIKLMKSSLIDESGQLLHPKDC